MTSSMTSSIMAAAERQVNSRGRPKRFTVEQALKIILESDEELSSEESYRPSESSSGELEYDCCTAIK